MGSKRSEKKFNSEIKLDKKHAQILININQLSKTYIEAKEIIEGLGMHILKTKYLSPNKILLKLDTKDMRAAALKLTENGFLVVKGYNAVLF
ncbi:MAG: hypothetical protein FJ115_11550 [Deltaproteobacteria bacterium]|nr:hypothetical protein [Deltaproteobacteria bacterium]MBM4324184.1 hypothetical protein [Deltaproteobacteria bacterium]